MRNPETNMITRADVGDRLQVGGKIYSVTGEIAGRINVMITMRRLDHLEETELVDFLFENSKTRKRTKTPLSLAEISASISGKDDS